MAVVETITNEVGARLGQRTDIGTRVYTWVNDALFELAHNPRFSFRELDRTHSFILIEENYNYSLDDIGDFWFPLSLWVIAQQRNSRVYATALETIFEKQDFSPNVMGLPNEFALLPNNLLTIYPGASATYASSVLLLYYRRRLSTLTTGSVIPLEREWEEPLTILAVIKGLEALQRFEEAALHRQTYEGLLQARLSHLELEEPMYETTIGVRFS